MSTDSVQLGLALGCPSCGSLEHDGCGYDPEAVRPAMSLPEALMQTYEAGRIRRRPTHGGRLFWRVPK